MGGGGGKGGGKGGGGYGYNNYLAGYNAWTPGGQITASPTHPEYSYFKAGWDARQAEWDQQNQLQEMMMGLSESFAPAEMPEGPSYEEQMAEQRRRQGIAERDALYSEYMDSASTAADYINQQIEQERANANLLGIDYNITDEMKSSRINDYFASLWGEGQQTRLEQLMKEYGNPEGFEGFTVTRGTAKTPDGPPGSTQETQSTNGGMSRRKPATALTDDQEARRLTSVPVVLGG